jgi:hypothetical protein
MALFSQPDVHGSVETDMLLYSTFIVETPGVTASYTAMIHSIFGQRVQRNANAGTYAATLWKTCLRLSALPRLFPTVLAECLFEANRLRPQIERCGLRKLRRIDGLVNNKLIYPVEPVASKSEGQ